MVMGKTFVELGINPDSDQRARHVAELQQRGRVIEAEVNLRTISGEVRVCMNKMDLIEIDQRKHILSFIEDITERKRTEEGLRQSEGRLAREVDALTKLHKVAVLSTNGADLTAILGEIVEVAISVSGADFGSIQLLDPATSDLRIMGQRGFPQWWLDFWNSTSKGKGACGTALERGERVIVEDVEQSPIFAGTPALEIQLRAGVRAVQSTPIVSRSGKPLGMFSTHYKRPQRPDERALQLLDLLARQAADILERAQMERSLRESEERFRQLVAATSVVVYRMGPDWSEMRMLRGRDFVPDTEEPSHTWLQKYIYPDDQARVMGAIRDAIQSKGVFELEHRVVRVDGSVGWTHSRAVPLLNADGEIVEWFGTAEDITARKENESDPGVSRQE
jgi:PAS domain-containing protein